MSDLKKVQAEAARTFFNEDFLSIYRIKMIQLHPDVLPKVY
jgi:hypothetical protein